MRDKKVGGYILFSIGIVGAILVIISHRNDLYLGVKLLVELLLPALMIYGGWWLAHRKAKIDDTNDRDWLEKD